MDIQIVAHEIAGAILAAHGTVPSTADLVQRFCDAYERLPIWPSDDDHGRICELVRPLITRR